MTETYFGEIVHNPKYWHWVEKNIPKDGVYYKLLKFALNPCGYTDKYYVWVVNTPNKLCTDRIFHASMSYARSKKMSSRASEYRRKAGMSWKE